MTWKIINIFAICESLLCSINVYCSHILFKWNPSLWLYNHFTYLWKLSTNTQNFTLDLWQVSYEINHHQWLIAHQAFIIFQIFTSFHDFCLFSEVEEHLCSFQDISYIVEEKFLHFFLLICLYNIWQAEWMLRLINAYGWNWILSVWY